MSRPLISVIVPVYNVEQYLKECVDSITSQTYSQLEILLIDDGSSDGSPAICDDFVQKDRRIKAIHQNNSGPAKARNVGIAHAQGEYITFIDSDDYVSCDYVEQLYNGLVSSNADISAASFSSSKGDFTQKQSSEAYSFEEITKKKAIQLFCSIKAESSMPFISACNKLYKKDLFQGISFPEGNLYEDAFTTFKLIDKARKIIFSSSKPYYYRLTPNSIMGQAFKEKHLEMIEAFRSGYNYFNQKYDNDISILFIPPLLMREIYCWWGAKEILKNKEMSQKLIKAYKKDCRNLKKGKQISLGRYFIFKLISVCPWIYIWYRRLSPIYLGDRK